MIDYIESLIKFKEGLLSAKSLDKILDLGIFQYSQLINSNSVSIYLFDKQTFEPILRKSVPILKSEFIAEYLEKAIDSGLIAEAINSNRLVAKEIGDGTTIILLPLITNIGALGFVLIMTDDKIDLIETKLNLQIRNFNSLLSLSINNHNLETDNKGFINKIDQIVATQTQELLYKKEQINDKVEQLKSSLLMTLPHEVRTPLNQILGLTDYLKNSLNETDKVEMQEILEDVHSSAVRLRRLFENYLYISTLTINSYNIEDLDNLQKEYLYSAESLINDTVSSLSMKYELKNSIKLDLVDSPIQMSEEHFNKLIYELIDNSIKFSKDNLEISIRAEVIDNQYLITIRDNGIGIPLERIYMLDAYIQFDRLSNEQQGSGLGLAIVKKITNIYGGEINFKSELDQFTEITLKLPIAEIDLDEI